MIDWGGHGYGERGASASTVNGITASVGTGDACSTDCGCREGD